MKVEIKVPAMGESISEATIGQIIKKTGSKVAVEDELFELETDKVNQVIYAPASGLFTLSVKPEEVVKIGQVVGYIDTEAAQVSAPEPVKPESPKQPAKEEPPKATEEPHTTARISKDAFLEYGSKSTPKIPEEIPPVSQPASLAPSSQEARETRKKMPKIRQVIAKRLVEAQQSTAMLTTFNEVDMSTVMKLRDEYKDLFLKKHGVKLGFMSFFVKASVEALKAIPDINSYIDGDEIVGRQYYDISIAVGTEKGLFVPVIRDCDRLSFADIEKNLNLYATKAREGKITVDDLKGGGFTITNGGVYGSLLSTPILNPPQSAILGMHKIEKRAVVINDQIVIRPMMYLALSYDHRIVDGKEAVTFLVHIKNILEDPSRLLLEV